MVLGAHTHPHTHTSTDPPTYLYNPAAQVVQVVKLALGAYRPAGHAVPVALVPPGPHAYPGGDRLQTPGQAALKEVPPRVVPNLPAVHRAQEEAPPVE